MSTKSNQLQWIWRQLDETTEAVQLPGGLVVRTSAEVEDSRASGICYIPGLRAEHWYDYSAADPGWVGPQSSEHSDD